ncbi:MULTISPECIES: hypothetical protein [unclassified Pedobacter]|uniref:hypothetical protein n=1 Tax=unclassified Pedobacter TaxID=2628915 RepID=UPI001D955DFA|nr:MULTISPECIES: hypothetical protein [unclassified Pedobacter]CAH0147520.1 hypothetical protein SRABI126_00453 [Pedobacter sp. Bi126]CAH0210822.1 hypothetical protein SRABI36_02228 [Pedobacter sp. Bi36]
MKTFLQSKLLQGIIISNVIVLIIIWLNNWLHSEKDGILVFSEFVILPLLMGVISSWFWRNLNLKSKLLIWYSILNGLLAILLSYIFLGEGTICLIIVSPLIFAFVITGAFIGKTMFRKNNQTLNVSIVSILLVIFTVDSISDHHYSNMVSDEIIVKAAPEKIWKNVVAFEKIKQADTYWLFKAGMPSPMQTTVTAYKKGAGRKCIFSNGYVFDEKIVTFDVNKDLTFDITGQPKDPEIMGHIDIERGQFLLKDNGDGTTTLVGNSWYSLKVFPIWYYDLWAESITRNVHLRVMHHIKELSEKN